MSATVQQVLQHKGQAYWWVPPDATVRDALDTFVRHDIGAVLVCNDGHLVGVLTERDCARKVMAKGHSADETRVVEVMSRALACVSPHDTIERCMALMNDYRVRHVPVVHGEHVLGVVSMGDVIHAVLHEKECLIEELEHYICGSPSARPSSVPPPLPGASRLLDALHPR